MTGPLRQVERPASFVGFQCDGFVGGRDLVPPRHLDRRGDDGDRTGQVALEEAGAQVGMTHQHRRGARPKQLDVDGADDVRRHRDGVRVGCVVAVGQTRKGVQPLLQRAKRQDVLN